MEKLHNAHGCIIIRVQLNKRYVLGWRCSACTKRRPGLLELSLQKEEIQPEYSQLFMSLAISRYGYLIPYRNRIRPGLSRIPDCPSLITNRLQTSHKISAVNFWAVPDNRAVTRKPFFHDIYS